MKTYIIPTVKVLAIAEEALMAGSESIPIYDSDPITQDDQDYEEGAKPHVHSTNIFDAWDEEE